VPPKMQIFHIFSNDSLGYHSKVWGQYHFMFWKEVFYAQQGIYLTQIQ